MDETGVLSNDPNQRFFALGLLKIRKTSSLFEEIKQLKDKHGKPRGFEFKFTGIKRDGHLPIHEELIDICLDHSGFYFSCIVVDKTNPNYTTPTSTWDMQIDLANTHIDRNVKINNDRNEQVAVIADYLSKPKSSTRYFEDELNRKKKVFNACMIESDASIFVQVVDILIGCVVYRYRMNNQGANTTTPKAKLVRYIESKLQSAYAAHNHATGNFKHKQDLEGTFTIFKPYYFSVFTKR